MRPIVNDKDANASLTERVQVACDETITIEHHNAFPEAKGCFDKSFRSWQRTRRQPFHRNTFGKNAIFNSREAFTHNECRGTACSLPCLRNCQASHDVPSSNLYPG